MNYDPNKWIDIHFTGANYQELVVGLVIMDGANILDYHFEEIWWGSADTTIEVKFLWDYDPDVWSAECNANDEICFNSNLDIAGHGGYIIILANNNDDSSTVDEFTLDSIEIKDGVTQNAVHNTNYDFGGTAANRLIAAMFAFNTAGSDYIKLVYELENDGNEDPGTIPGCDITASIVGTEIDNIIVDGYDETFDLYYSLGYAVSGDDWPALPC